MFVGASAGGVLTREMVRSMAPSPVVLALATPEPEIGYEAAHASRPDAIVATSLDAFPNAVLDLLSFPYIFRGALDVQATRITTGMLMAAAHALADLAREEVPEEVERAYGRERFRFGPEYLLPKPIDPRILVRESAAVARQAVEEGVARRPLDTEAVPGEPHGPHRDRPRDAARDDAAARQRRLRVVFPEGTSATILRACSVLVDEGLATPGAARARERGARGRREARPRPGRRPGDRARRRARASTRYVEEYFRMRRRRGVMRAAAEQRLRQPDYFAAHDAAPRRRGHDDLRRLAPTTPTRCARSSR